MIAVLVVFHELGHFAAARLAGIRVEEFAFGFGPKLFRLFRRGDTEYTVHPFPLGGFVKLAGMEPGQEDIPDGYQAQPAWKRALVIFSGPFMSFVLGAAVFVFLGIYWGFPDPFNVRNEVGMVSPQTEAARIGLRAGDRILKIDGVAIKRGLQMVNLIHHKPGKRVTLLIERDHQRITKTGTPRWRVQYLEATWSFMNSKRATFEEWLSPEKSETHGLEPGDVLISINGKQVRGGPEMVRQIERNDGRPVRLEMLRGGKSVTLDAGTPVRWVRYLGTKWGFPGTFIEGDGELDPNSEAKKLGLQLGDVLVSIDGGKIKSGEDMVRLLRSAKSDRLTLVTRRIDKQRTVTAPKPAGQVETGYYDAVGLLGFAPAPTLKKTALAESVKQGILVPLGIAMEHIKTFTSRKRLQEDIGGPVMIAKTTQTFVARGPYWVMVELGALSLSFAFVNLLPIPVLDGGHLAILAVEALRRKKLTPQQMAAVQMAGLTIVVTLVMLIFFSDIAKIAGGKVPQ